jgi:hypothetical protein
MSSAERLQQLRAMARQSPGKRYYVLVTEPPIGDIICTIGIAKIGSCEVKIPRQKWDPEKFFSIIPDDHIKA